VQVLRAIGAAAVCRVPRPPKASRIARWVVESDRARSSCCPWISTRKEVDFLRHAVEELAALDPKPGEETELAERRTLMQQGERRGRCRGR
jgi:hypothetical protein